MRQAAARTAGAAESDANEGAGGGGAAPIVGIALVSPGSDEKERSAWGIRVLADSSIARRASPASVGPRAHRRRNRRRSRPRGGRRSGRAGKRAAISKPETADAHGGGAAARSAAIASPVGVSEGDGIFLRAARRSTASPVTNVRTSTAASFRRPSSPGSSSAQTTPASRSRITIGTRSVRAGACPPRARRSGPDSSGGSASIERCDLSSAADEGIVLAAEVERAHGLVASAGRVEADGLPPGEPVVAQDEERDARGVRVHAREEAREDVDLRAGRLDRRERTAHDGPVGLGAPGATAGAGGGGAGTRPRASARRGSRGGAAWRAPGSCPTGS